MGKVGGVILILIVIGVIGYMVYSGEQEKLELKEQIQEQLEVIIKKFPQGETIEFYSPPAYTGDEVASLNAERAFNTFTDGDEVIVDQVTGEIITGGNITSESFGHTEKIAPQEVLSGIHVLYQGELVKIKGKIVKESPAPYFYNLEITCCDGTEVLQVPHIQTDADGSFLYTFTTSDKTPVGVYLATVYTTSEDTTSLIQFEFKFQVIV